MLPNNTQIVDESLAMIGTEKEQMLCLSGESSLVYGPTVDQNFQNSVSRFIEESSTERRLSEDTQVSFQG